MAKYKRKLHRNVAKRLVSEHESQADFAQNADPVRVTTFKQTVSRVRLGNIEAIREAIDKAFECCTAQAAVAASQRIADRGYFNGVLERKIQDGGVIHVSVDLIDFGLPVDPGVKPKKG